MHALLWTLLSVLFLSVLSFIGVLSLSVGKGTLKRLLMVFVAFASGSLLATALIHMAPEAVRDGGDNAFTFVLGGIIMFFVIEKFIHWHHCGKEDCDVRPVGYLNLLGDGLHNFIDGVIIAAAFLTNTEVGIVTTFAIALHEIPQEFGDFSVLLHSGMSTRKALFYNFLSASTAILGALVGYSLLAVIHDIIPYVIAVAAGGFIYIATADLMPELHKEKEFKHLLRQTTALFAGVIIIYFASMIMPGH